jgi:kynurenine formamidase
MKTAALLAVALLVGIGTAQPSRSLDLSAYRLVDLTHAYSSKSVFWPTSPTRFTLEKLAYGPTEGGYFYSAYTLCTPEHGGTHLDAPIHFGEGKRTADQVPLEQLMGPAIVIDISQQSASNRDYRLAADDVMRFEREHGRIPERSIVLLRTGWSRHWPNAKAYLGDDTPGDASKLSFPGYGADAAKLLIEQRRASALGIDSASIDYGRSTDFQVHRLAAAQNVPGFENLTNLDQLPPVGATVIALPMKIEGGSGGPLRAVGMIRR